MTIKRNQQRHLQEAQAEHKVEAEFGGEGIALIEGGLNVATGLVQAGVIDGNSDITPFAPGQRTLEDGLKKDLGAPGGAGVQAVIGAPVLLLTAEGPDGARQSAATESGENAERLGDRAVMRALLRKGGLPGLKQLQQGRE